MSDSRVKKVEYRAGDRVVSPDTVPYYGLWQKDTWRYSWSPILNEEYHDLQTACKQAEVWADRLNVPVCVLDIRPYVEKIAVPPERPPA